MAAVQAVKLGESPCVMREFDERKRVITVFNPHRLALDSLDYAVVDPEKERFEAFRVTKRLTDQTFKIGRRLERGFGSHFPICRVVHGSVQPDGSYLLRVPNSSGDARWIIRLQRGEEELFRTVDFLKPETTTPEALAAGQEGRG
ncbi:hypothetical protein SDC9_149682 [bioreactor metagenome]|uniref:Uncharacterized protein n=1 Tax=bioreactor metagenome TaxID=1076179 RepID=A0A645ELZ8_9ZZZZ